MTFATELRKYLPVLLQLAVVLLVVCEAADVSSGTAAADPSQRREDAEKRRQAKRVYSLVDHIVRICLYAFMSAVFAGLTLGVMCADTFTLEIIAESGPKPDCKYAATVLPLRRMGHKTLCTLIVSNMLCNVLIVQEFSTIFDIIHAIRTRGNASVVVDDSGSSLWNFIVSTTVIVIFAEIIPMSICKSKHSLRVAAAGTTFVWIAMVLTFPVSWPLGKFLDWVVGTEETGQIFERKELRKLMVIHYERNANGGNANMAESELNMLLSAMDFQDRTVKDIMTPLDKVFKVKGSDLITPDFIERVWLSGRSRVPVESADGHFHHILVVKDLMSLSKGKDFDVITVEELVKTKSRLFAVVGEGTKLPSMMKFFQEAKTHMAVVISEDFVQNNSSAASDFMVDSASSPRLQTGPQSVIGIVTMEDVVEELLGDEIYDEYDRYNNDEDGTSPLQLPPAFPGLPAEPSKKPRVNFYSFFTHPEQDIPLTQDQLWSIVYFLNRTVPVFEMWAPGCIKMLLDECKDMQLVVPPSRRVSFVNPNPNVNPSNSTPVISPNRADPVGEKFDIASNSSASLPGGPGGVLPFRLTDHSSFLNMAESEKFVLYSKGVPTKYFTLVLGGVVDLLVGNDSFFSKLCTFNFIGEEALTSEFYAPVYSAIVRKAARVIRIPRESFEKYVSLQNYQRSSARRVRVLTSAVQKPKRRSTSHRREGHHSPHPEAAEATGLTESITFSTPRDTRDRMDKKQQRNYGTL